MFWPRGGCLVYNLISFFSLLIIFPNFFHGISYVIWITLSFNCRYPSMCVHTSHRPYGYSLLMLCSWQQTHWNPWCNLRHLYCNCTRYWLPCGMKTITCTSFIHIQLLSWTSQHCVHQRWHLHPRQRCDCQPNVRGFISSILHNSRIFHHQCSSSQGKKLLQLTPHWSIPPFSKWGIWLLTQTCQCAFTQLC
jgi:hypothetical protein